MNRFSLLFVLFSLVSGCQIKTASPVDDGTLPGRFRLEADPLRCSLPTTQQVTIQPTSADTYLLEYDRFGVSSHELTGVTATKTSETKYDLTLKGQAIGQYAFEEIRNVNGTQKKWILLLHHETDKPNGLAFMGVKE